MVVETDTNERLAEAARREMGEWLYGKLVATIAYTGDPVTVADLVEGSLASRYQWFQHERDAVCVTHIELGYEGRVVNLLYSAGDLRVLRSDILPRVVDFAERSDCAAIIAYGRPGWSRVAPHCGFEKQGERYVRHLPNKKEDL